MIPWLGFERRWRDALLAAALPSPGPGRPGAGDLDLDGFCGRLFAVAPPILRLGLRAAVWALSLGAPFFLGRCSTFRGLAPEEQDRLLVAADDHRFFLVRQLAVTVKLVACFAYFEDAGARAFVEGAVSGVSVRPAAALPTGEAGAVGERIQ